MPKAGSITPRKILRILLKNGFVVDRVTGSHYILFHSTNKRRVLVAYHTKVIPKGTSHKILKLAGISLDDL